MKLIKGIRNTLIVLIVCLTAYLIYEMYPAQAQDLLAQLTSGRYGERTAVVETEKEIAEESLRTDLPETTYGKQEGSLPAFYDCRVTGKAPVVKSQGTLGTCWAVAASSALESVLLPKESVVFSADHISTQNSYSNNQEEGGACLISTAYLAAWQGPVTEEQDPYGDSISAEGLSAVRHVQEIQMVTDRDFGTIKRLIYDYGAVQCSVYMDMGGDRRTSPYYDPVSASYYYDGSAQINHDVLIIGWDDTYPAENFTHLPDRDGAFICQNSWGESFGENGIFYVSYEDSWIGSNCAAYTKIEPADNYDHIYQSDLCGWVGQMGYGEETCWFANVYQAESDQILRAVGFYATGRDTEYEICVVPDYQNTFSLVLYEKVQTGKFKNTGYYTAELKKSFDISAGQKFAVLVKIRTPGSKYPVAMEYRADASTEQVILDDGEGYVSADGYRWIRMEEEYDGNICLKAYTDEK